jgi:hypothetical protein
MYYSCVYLYLIYVYHVQEYINCLNNLAQCFIFKNDLVKAKDVCVRVLELDRRNIKALFRAAKVALATHEYIECELCLDTLKQIEPSHPNLPAGMFHIFIFSYFICVLCVVFVCNISNLCVMCVQN